MITDESKKVVVMGGGPAGLTAAYQLSKAGVESLTLEMDNDVGGISRTASYKGYHFDIGGHRFFTKVAVVEEMWREVIDEAEYLRRSRLSRIFYNGKFFYYPLKIGNALRGLGLWNSMIIGFSFIKAQIFPRKPEVSFEDWVSNRFGSRLYRTFFKTYTEKVWGIPCSELSAEWAGQRIKGLSLFSAVRNALIGSQSKDKSKVIKTLIDAFDYPRYGPGMMWRATRDLVQAAGSEVRLESKVVSIQWNESGVTAVEVEKDGEKVLEAGTHFLSTLPMRELIHRMDPPAPPEIIKAADDLSYRDFLTVALIIDQDDLFPDNWIYIHDPSVHVGRIQNFKNWSPDMVAEKHKTCLGLEYFCSEGDELWEMDDAALVKLGAEEIARLGLADGTKIEDGTVVRQPKAYPVYDSIYKEAVLKIRTFLSGTLPNLQLIGRNGMHKYNNQDHSMLTAMLAAKNILGGNHNIWEVNVEQKYHEQQDSDEASVELSEEEQQLAEVEVTQPHVPKRVGE